MNDFDFIGYALPTFFILMSLAGLRSAYKYQEIPQSFWKVKRKDTPFMFWMMVGFYFLFLGVGILFLSRELGF